MSQPDRFDIVVPLHEISGWRRALAVDRGGVAPRTVVISYPPSALTDDPTRLVGLMRDAEAAALVHHPNAVPALGLETAGDLLVAVEAYRRGVSLRALLEVARRLPPELAARVAVDACAALAAVHAVDPGDGHPLAHGGVAAERLLVADDGATLLCGTGTAGGGAQAEDVRAVGAVLLECLLGDPSAPTGEVAAASEIPPQLLEVARRATGDVPGGAFEDAEALGGAIREAVRAAPPEAMAAYLEAIMPAGEGERGELLRLVANALSRAAQPARAEGSSRDLAAAAPAAAVAAGAGGVAAPVGERDLVSDDATGAPAPSVALAPSSEPEARPSVASAGGPALPVTAAAPSPQDAPVAAPPSGHIPAAAPAVADMAPMGVAEPPLPSAAPASSPPPSAFAEPRTSRSRVVLAVAISMAILGFGGGLLFSRGGRAPAKAPGVAPAPVTAAPAQAPAAAPGPASPSPVAAPAPAPEERPTATAAAPPAPAPSTPASPPAGAASIAVSAEPPGEVYVDGKRVGRSPVTVPIARGDHEVRLRSTYEGVDVRRRVTVRGAGTPVRFALRRGALKVTAPQDAEVFVDGKHVGRGDVKVDLWEGNHLVEARLGQARVHEKFTLGPGETWTYDVSPTP